MCKIPISLTHLSYARLPCYVQYLYYIFYYARKAWISSIIFPTA